MDQGTVEMIKTIGIIGGAIAALIGLVTAIVQLLKKRESKNQSTTTDSHGYTGNDGAAIIETVEGDATVSQKGNNPELSNIPSKKEEGMKIRHIKLAKVYTSVFAEDGLLHTETIRLEDSADGQISGVVELLTKDGHGKVSSSETYRLSGTFDNKILTGEYYSTSETVDERGTINLKLISDTILSGFCSFSKISSKTDDEIRMSPYVWVAGENIDLVNGTYSFCTDCFKERADCCCASEDVDTPVLLHDEASIIQAVLPAGERKIAAFSFPIDKTPVRQIRRDSDENTESQGKCHFFDIGKKVCSIYNKRPVDCRLFPFDIILDETTGEYFVGYYPALCKRTLPDVADMKLIAHILRPYFFLLYPYAHIITQDKVCVRLKKAEFKKIAKLRDFIF